ncbi:HtaA domain-containing protein [Glycomyces sp. NRRL B-16210]|uniref:HtaA domain-containing protein n=1 Tax=Glycomyces sp. NRRL B-16210 TaxID=1463821 RepID=UPI0004C191F1|nr:HtaA domain-containing protein [Glycomyces sp. NRRL B-16210]
MKSSTRKRLAGLAALAVGAGVAVGLAASPAHAQETGQHDIVDGSLSWGIKQSFRNYIVSPIAHGSITLGGGATQNGDGSFTFGGAEGAADLDAGTYAAETDGSVYFYGHDGELDLLFENFAFTADDASQTGTIYVDVTTSGVLAEGVEFATFDYSASPWQVSGGVAQLDGAPAVLTEDGATAFAGFYSAGTELDPVSIVAGLEEVPVDPPTTDTPTDDDTTDEPTTDEPTGTPATVYDVTGGEADWGVKESFRNYITGPIAHGEITLLAPATENADGTYRFPNASGAFTAETCALDASFEGGVNFYGHDGELDLDLADLSVKSVDGGLAVYSGADLIANVSVDELAVTGGAITVDGAPATVAAAGVDFFGGFYPEGSDLDAVSFTVELAGAPDTTCEPTGNPGGNPGGNADNPTKPAGAGSPKLPTTGSPLTIVLAAAAALLIAGVAVMVLTRRRALQAGA